MTAPKLAQHYSLALRLWHWLNALVIFGLLGTVFLRKTLLNWRTNSALIETKLQAAGMAITPVLSKEIAVSIRNPLWDWHEALGVTLALLLIIRALTWLIDFKKGHHKNEIFFPKPKTPHEKFIRVFHALFYVFTLGMVVSGILMTYSEVFGLTKNTLKNLKEIHESSMWFFVVFIVLHVLGVLKAESSQENHGIVSRMLNGKKC